MRRTVLLAVLVLGLVALIACGPAEQATPTPTKAPAAATATPTTVPAVATPTPTLAPGVATPTRPPAVATPTPTATPSAPVRLGKYGGTLRIGSAPKSEELFFAVNSGGNQHEWGEALSDVLLAYGPDSEWNKDKSLAVGFEMGSDLLSVTLKLRQGVKFHDGTDFNAASVKHNLDWVLEPKNAAAFRPQIATITSVTVVDPYTVKLTLSQVHTAILTNLGLRSTFAFSPTAFDKLGRKAFDSKPVGAGPFMAKEFVPAVYIVFEKNPNYWNKGLPYLDAIRWDEIVDERVRAGALQSGQVDLVNAMTAGTVDAIKAVRAISGVQEFKAYAGPTYDHINAARAPFNDKRVRQALQMAMDRDAWNKVMTNGEGVPYRGSMHTLGHAANYVVPEAQFPYPYNPAKAKALIEEYAKEKGLKLPLDTVGAWEPTAEQAAKGAVALKAGPIIMIGPSSADNRKRAELSKAYYEAIGFKIEVLIGGGDEEIKTFVTKEAGFSLRGVGTRPHPSGSMDSYMGYGGYWNMGGWNTSPEQMEVDRLLKEAARTIDTAAQNKLYQQAQKIWMEEALGAVKTAHLLTPKFALPQVKMDQDIKKWFNYPSDNTAHVSFLWLDK